MRIASGVSATLAVAALLLSGCGSDDDKSADGAPSSGPAAEESNSSGAAAGPLDACTLLTPADLKQAFGSPFNEGDLTHQDQTGGDQCVWTNEDAPPVKTFSITVLRQGSLEGAIKSSGLSVSELHAQTKAVYPDAVPIDLGDDAYLAETELAVLKGDTLYTFSTFLGTSDTAISGLKALAAQVVG